MIRPKFFDYIHLLMSSAMVMTKHKDKEKKIRDDDVRHLSPSE